MNIPKANFIEETVLIEDLILDEKNPRMFRLLSKDSDNISQEDIIDYLKEYEDLSDLKNKITSNGWDIAETPWVIVQDGKYIVKEGNRRVATLKLIKDELNIDAITVKIYNDI